MASSVKREIRQLQKAGNRLADTTQNWDHAFRTYRQALRQLHRKTTAQKPTR